MVALLLYACGFICCAQDAVVSSNSAHSSHFKVEVTRVVSYGSDVLPLFEVTLTYSFDSQQTVWLKGLGVLPAKATLSYFATTKELEFRDSPRGGSLVAIPLRSTFFPAIAGPIFPAISDFHNPGPKRVSVKSLEEITKAVLDALGAVANLPPKSCPAPWEDNCLITAWITLPNVSKPLEGQVAIMITFVPKETRGKAGPQTTITLALEERQTLVGSGIWHEAGDAVRNAAKEKLSKLLDELDTLASK